MELIYFVSRTVSKTCKLCLYLKNNSSIDILCYIINAYKLLKESNTLMERIGQTTLSLIKL